MLTNNLKGNIWHVSEQSSTSTADASILHPSSFIQKIKQLIAELTCQIPQNTVIHPSQSLLQCRPVVKHQSHLYLHRARRDQHLNQLRRTRPSRLGLTPLSRSSLHCSTAHAVGFQYDASFHSPHRCSHDRLDTPWLDLHRLCIGCDRQQFSTNFLVNYGLNSSWQHPSTRSQPPQFDQNACFWAGTFVTQSTRLLSKSRGDWRPKAQLPLGSISAELWSPRILYRCIEDSDIPSGYALFTLDE